MLKEGEKAPLDLKLINSDGEDVVLGELLNQDYLVIYFYPKDDTPGCTTQACQFRDYNTELTTMGVKVIGISKDDKDSHSKFAAKHDLNFELLSDEDSSLQKAFGVWVEKNMFGNKYMGTQRSCFILNKEGEVLKIWPKASPKNNAKDVYDWVTVQK